MGSTEDDGRVPGERRELPDLLAPRVHTPPAWLRALYVAGALVCFALGVIGWLVPVVTGLPFYVAGLVLLGVASERVRRLLNRAERKLPHVWRGRLRRALRRVPGGRFADLPDDA